MKAIKITTAVVITSMVMGCQGNDPFDRQSNPFPEAMKNYTPDIPEAADEQTVKVKTYDVSVEGQMQSSQVLHFVAGEASEYRIQARSFVDQTTFTLKGHNLPDGVKLAPVASEPGVWTLSWNPSIEVIPNGQQGVDKDISIEFVVVEGTSPRAKYAHAPFEKMTNFRLTVRHNDQQPVITSASDFETVTSVAESSGQVNFNLVVVDPQSNGDHPPELVERHSFESSDTSLPGSFALFSNGAPTFKGSGEWVFPMTFNLRTLANHYRNLGEGGSSLNVSISLKAESTVTNNESPYWSKTLSVSLEKKETEE